MLKLVSVASCAVLLAACDRTLNYENVRVEIPPGEVERCQLDWIPREIERRYLLRLVLAQGASDRIVTALTPERDTWIETVLCGTAIGNVVYTRPRWSGPWLSSRKSEYRDGYWHVLDVADVVEVLRCLQKDSHAEVTISPAAAARMASVGLRADDWGTVTESTTEDDLSD